MIYSVQFPTGFETIVIAKLKIDLKARILVEEEGLILFLIKGILPPIKIKNLDYVSSLDSVLFWCKNIKSLEDLAGLISKDTLKNIKLNTNKNFQLRTFINNQPSGLGVRNNLISLISSTINLEFNSHKPDYIFNLKFRKSGLGTFSLKLKSDDKKYNKGELHQSVASLLCLLGGAKNNQIILDAFGGYGGISNVIKNFKPKKLIICEKDANLASKLISRFTGMNYISIRNENVIQFLNKTEHKFDLILADPPWGEFERVLNLENLYVNFLLVALSKLNPGGKIVIISSNKAALGSAIIKFQLQVNNQLDILISGKKARVYCLGNNS